MLQTLHFAFYRKMQDYELNYYSYCLKAISILITKNGKQNFTDFDTHV